MKFDVILTDFPWLYNDRNANGNRGAACKYSVMSLIDIKALPIADVASDNCALFVWATMPLLKEAFEVIEAYGFKFKTAAFCWTKTNKNNDRPFFGLGHFTRSNAELCLLATKGKPIVVSKSVSSVVISPRMRHSQKPDIVQDRIEQLFGDNINRLEVFATRMRDGWTCLGYDIDGRDIRETLPELIER